MTDVKHPAAVKIVSPEGEAAEVVRKSAVIGGREKAVDVERRRVSVTLSTPEVDRDGDIIRQEGWRLDRYRQNPVVLFAHDPRQPVARGESIRLENGLLIGDMAFPPKGECKLSDEVFALYEHGVLSAVSVGFMPTRMQPRTDERGAMAGYDIQEAELFEFSAVSIPSNPGALVRAKAQGLGLGEVAKALDAYLADHADADVRKAYVEITGAPHPTQQAELAAANFGEKGTDEPAHLVVEVDVPDGLVLTDDAPDTKAAPGTAFTTTGGDGHEHAFTLGEGETEPAGDPEHVHAVTYDADGVASIEANEGHTHEAPASAVLDDPDEDEDEDDEGEMEEDGKAAEPAVNSPEADALRADWPALAWLADMNPTTPEAREKWRALVVAEKGKIIAEREKALGIEIVATPQPAKPDGLSADEARALADMIGKAVNEQLRRLTGRA